MKHIVVDLEANGLDDATKIHCLSYCVVDEWDVHTLYTYEDISNFFKQEAVFILHYGSNYDLPLLNKLLGIDFTDVIFYDTHLLSNYIFPGRQKYSLESFGEDYGVAKVSVGKDEWDGNMEDEAYKNFITSRCETDIRINTNLWVDIMRRLNKLYDNDTEAINKLLKYVAFKARRAYEQQLNPLLINVKAAEDLLVELYKKKEEKESILRQMLPKVPQYQTKEIPKVMYKKDGTLSTVGQRWIDFLKENNLPLDNTKPVKYVKGFEEPNPQSNIQIKSFLYSLNWSPCSFRYERNKDTNERKAIPQILGESKELTPSVAALLEKEPRLIELEGLGVVNHRISLINGILEEAYKKDGKVSQTLHGVTNTFRFTHRTLVNLPSTSRPWGSEIRGLIIAPPGHVVMSVDVKNLESRTMQNSIIDLDEPYVRQMNSPDFDAHLDTSISVGLISQEDADFYKFYKSTYGDGKQSPSEEESTRFKIIDVKRKKGKIIGFSSLYNVGAKTLSISLGESEEYCKVLLQNYWARNWATKYFAENLATKQCLGNTWVKSKSGSGFFLELRKENDRFSTHNQNYGVTFFDNWQAYLWYYGLKVRLESHDEILLYVKEEEVEEVKVLLKRCCEMANRKLNLPVYVDIDIQVGKSYADTH